MHFGKLTALESILNGNKTPKNEFLPTPLSEALMPHMYPAVPFAKSWQLVDQHFEWFAHAHAKAKAIRKKFFIHFDSSPVMDSPDAYLAMLDKESAIISLNQTFLDKAIEPDFVKRFLIYHELYHFLEEENKVTLIPEIVGSFDVEDRADALGIVAVQKMIQLTH